MCCCCCSCTRDYFLLHPREDICSCCWIHLWQPVRPRLALFQFALTDVGAALRSLSLCEFLFFLEIAWEDIYLHVSDTVSAVVRGWVVVQKRGIGQCSGWVVQRKFFRFVCLHYNFHDARMSHHSPMNERTGWEGAAVVVSLLRLSPLPSTVCVELLLLLLMGNHFISS